MKKMCMIQVDFHAKKITNLKIRVGVTDNESCRSVRSHDGISECEETGDNFDDEYGQNKKQLLEEQLKDIRQQKHNLVQEETQNSNNIVQKVKFGTNYHCNEMETSNSEIWAPNAILVLKDSMIDQMD